MKEGDTADLADRLRFHVQALTSELGLGDETSDQQSSAKSGTVPLDQQRLMTARAWISACAVPGRAFQDDCLFVNPALNLLLDLYLNHASQRSVSISSACIAAGVPSTTGLRWIERLVRCGYIDRVADAADGRRAFVSLSDSGITKMNVALDAAVEGDRRVGVTRLHFAA